LLEIVFLKDIYKKFTNKKNGSPLEYLKQDEAQIPKILFTGLDNAGKTSIIIALQREFSKIAILSPTKGAQRRIFEFLGREIAEWDLGGQHLYRIAYLKNPDRYFDRTEILIYVVDIQDAERYSEAISYLDDVIKQLKRMMLNPPIYIFLHKFDPTLIRKDLNNYINLTDGLMENIKKTTNYEKIMFYKTSIYDFSTIIRAMSEILLGLYPKAELIEKTLKEFANKINCEGLTLIDDNSLVIGSYYKDEDTKHILNASTPYFLTLNDSFQNIAGRDEEIQDHILVQRYGRYILFKQFKLRPGFPPYYIILIKRGQYFYKDDFSSLAHLLKEIIYQ